jgi:hypothetical protein
MSRISVTLFALALPLAAGGLAAAGRGDPCEKAVDRMIECVGGESKALKKKMTRYRDEQIEACKKSDPRKKAAKECLSETDCAKFMACISEAH